MKIKMLSVYSRILSFFLVLLGFTSCDEIDPKVEYGVPIAKFKVKGTIVDDDSDNPVAKIKTVLGQSYEIDGKLYVHYIDSVLTNNEGKFELKIEEFPASQTFVLKIEDIDGEQNGGAFETKIESVEFKNPNFTNGNGWYAGEAEKDMQTIKITPVKKD
ncbi:MAG: radical SAM-associated putative lipoprotein [Prevotella sp.]|jgi:putative lipoprotein (rSAM/lipoprotein system)|nr:radical SAM-associated putative lipoprotein [Prevotella sp.]